MLHAHKSILYKCRAHTHLFYPLFFVSLDIPDSHGMTWLCFNLPTSTSVIYSLSMEKIQSVYQILQPCFLAIIWIRSIYQWIAFDQASAVAQGWGWNISTSIASQITRNTRDGTQKQTQTMLKQLNNFFKHKRKHRACWWQTNPDRKSKETQKTKSPNTRSIVKEYMRNTTQHNIILWQQNVPRHIYSYIYKTIYMQGLIN